MTVCPGDNATFICMTTGGALLWKTNSEAGNRFFSTPSMQPTSLGIFEFRLLGFRQSTVGNTTVLEVNSTATATDLQPDANRVTLNCSETLSMREVQAVLIAGKNPLAIYTVLLDKFSSYSHGPSLFYT